MINSEKKLYTEDYYILKMNYDTDMYLWGEDLLSKTLVIYNNGEIDDQLEFLSLIGGWEECVVIVVNPKKGKPLKGIECIISLETNQVFLSEEQFNSNWSLLKKSIEFENNGDMVWNHEPQLLNSSKDILDLSRLERNSSIAFVEKDKIVYKAKVIPKEEIRKTALKQRILEKQNNLFFYEKDGETVHDKDCAELNEIEGGNLVGSEEFPVGKEYCTQCMRRLLVRVGCAPHAKNIPLSNRFFDQNNVKTSQLRRLVMENKFHFYCENPNEMKINGAEDSWKIIVRSSGKLELWHNNYMRVNAKERYITEGYHDQNLRYAKLGYILNYIMGYSWEKHLEAEEKTIIEPLSASSEAVEITEDVTLDNSIKSKVITCVRNKIAHVFRRNKNN